MEKRKCEICGETKNCSIDRLGGWLCKRCVGILEYFEYDADRIERMVGFIELIKSQESD